MSKSKWKDKSTTETIIKKLKEIMIKEGKKQKIAITHSFGNYKTKFFCSIDEYVELLTFNTRFNSEIPPKIRDHFITESILLASDNNLLNQARLSEYVKDFETKYLNQKKKRFVVLSTVSINKSNPLQSINYNENLIQFHSNKPNNFDITNTIKMSDYLSSNDKSLKNFTYVKSHVNARCITSAFLLAQKNFDFIRGIWNFVLNLNTGERQSFGVPDRVNKIYFGPCHTLHDLKGKRISETYWYSTHINKNMSVYNCGPEFKDCKKFEQKIRKIFKSNPEFGSFIKIIFIRYANALDNENMTEAFTGLWSILELITKTEKENYSITIKRTSFIFKDKKFTQVILENLRSKRN